MLGDSSSVKLTGREQAEQKYDRQEESRYQSTNTVSVFFSFGRLQLLGNDTEIMSVEVLLYIFLFPSTQEYAPIREQRAGALQLQDSVGLFSGYKHCFCYLNVESVKQKNSLFH